jgi:hypothetical protein
MLFAVLALCLVQSAMTFSRSGLYMAFIAMVGASLCLLSNRAGRRMVVGSVVAIVLAYAVVAPRLTSFTGGALEERFQDTGSPSDPCSVWELAKRSKTARCGEPG